MPPRVDASVAPPAASSGPSPVDAAIVDGGANDTGGPAPGAAPSAPAPIVADNKVAPTQEAELQERAKGLLDAIARDEPSLGDPFWFPREPFIPLKDVKGPDKYWAQLHRTYANDIHALHKKRASWDGVTFEGFELGSPPKWVKPGEEANKIGYYRSFRGKLRFVADGKHESLEVRTVITWQGRWYITHLSKFKK